MDWASLLLTLLSGATVIYYLFFRQFGKLEKLGILHKKPTPIFGNMASSFFRRSTFQNVVTETYRMNEGAKYVGFYDFAEPVIMIRAPELIKSITVKNFDHFVDHRGFSNPEYEPLFGRNLFNLRGEQWREMRNILTPAFTGSKMKAMFKLMSDCGENFANYLAEKSTNEPYVTNVKDAFTRYTNDVIATCAFGISVDSMRNPDNDFYVLGRKATNFEGILSVKFFLFRSFPRLSQLLNLKLVDPKVGEFFEGVVRETIETRDREGITRPDMIQLMMETRKKNPDGSCSGLSIQDMTAQAFVFFFGGFDTTSTLMSFAAMEIAIDESVQKRLVDEIDAVLRANNGQPTFEAINGMQYLDAVIAETLRLYPILAFLDRLCVKRFELPPALPGAEPLVIEPGQNVWFPVYSMHRDSKYHAEPDKFDPERFLSPRKNDIDPFTYFPFGQGPRMCIGNRFALLEAKVAIFHLLAKCHLKPSPKAVVPIVLSAQTFAMTPVGGYWLQLEARATTCR